MESLSDGGVVALHKGQTPKVKTCAGQSFSQACITSFLLRVVGLFGTTLIFNSFSRLRLLSRKISGHG